MRFKSTIQEEIKPKIVNILKNKVDVYNLKNALKLFLLFLKILILFCFSTFNKKYLEKLEKEMKR